MEPIYSARDRQILTQRIGELGSTEHREIYGIIKQHNIEHTRNNNGVFINMTVLPNDVVDVIHKFVAFCHDNKVSLDEYDKRLNECKFLCGLHNEQQHTSSPSKETVVVIQPLPPIAEAEVSHPPIQQQQQQQQQQQIQLSAPSSVTYSSFKQTVKRFSRKRGCDSSRDGDAMLTDTLTPDVALIPDKSAAPCQQPPESPCS
jgi:hypothetical protein